MCAVRIDGRAGEEALGNGGLLGSVRVEDGTGSDGAAGDDLEGREALLVVFGAEEPSRKNNKWKS